MRIAAAIFLILAGASNVAGQSDSLVVKEKAIRYVFTINSGTLFCRNCNLSPSSVPTTIHGIELFKRWRIGGGIGYTSFRNVNTMPYFGSVSVDMPDRNKNRGLYAEWNFGSGWAWLGEENTDPYQYPSETVDYVTMPVFHQISLGYFIRYHKVRLATYIGYQQAKTIVKYTYGEPSVYDGPMYDYIMPAANSRVENITKRLLVGISIGI